MAEEVVFIHSESLKLHDRMDPEYQHPERVETVKKLAQLEKKGIIKVEKLDSLFTVSKEQTAQPTSTILPCIEMESIDVDFGLITSIRKQRLSEAGTSTIGCKGGNILFSGIRPYLNKVTLIPNSIRTAICSNEFYVLSPIKQNAPLGYLWLILRSPHVLNQSRHMIGGALRPRIGDDEISKLYIPMLEDKSVIRKVNSAVARAFQGYYPALIALDSAETHFLSAINLPYPPRTQRPFFRFADDQPDSPRSFYRMDPLFFDPAYYRQLKNLLEKWSKLNNGAVETLEDS